MSPPGNLIVSGLVRLRRDDPPAPTLALVAGVALCEALRPPDLMTLKWPNDVMAGPAKVAGILLERHGDAVVCGFGANLAHHPDLPDRATTSVAALTGAAPDPQATAERLGERFDAGLAVWRGEGVAAVVARWLTLAHPIGTPLRVALPDGETIEGAFDGLDAIGALRLRAGGAVRILHAGDVFAL